MSSNSFEFNLTAEQKKSMQTSMANPQQQPAPQPNYNGNQQQQQQAQNNNGDIADDDGKPCTMNRTGPVLPGFDPSLKGQQPHQKQQQQQQQQLGLMPEDRDPNFDPDPTQKRYVPRK